MATKYATKNTAMNASASTWGTLFTDGVYNQAAQTLTPTVSQSWTVDALIGLYVEINLVLYTIDDNDANSLHITVAGPANGTYRCIVYNEATPGNGDICNLNGAVVTLDMATFPVSGTLVSIISQTTAAIPANSVARLAVPMDVLGNTTILATAISAGSDYGAGHGLVETSGAAPANTLAIGAVGNVCTITAGGANNAHAIYHNSTAALVVVGPVTASGAGSGIYNKSTGSVTVTGDISGGRGNSDFAGIGIYNFSSGAVTVIGAVTGSSGSNNSSAIVNESTGAVTITGTVTGGTTANVHGIRNKATGAVTVTGNVVGGSGTNALGIISSSTAVVTLDSCNLINGAGGVAYSGYPPTWNIGAANYAKWGSIYMAAQLHPAEYLEGIVNGTADGAGHGGAGLFHDPENDEVKKDAPVGVPPRVGTYDPPVGGGGGGNRVIGSGVIQ